MTKLAYLAAMALLGLGLTAAQNSSTPSDSSNSSKPSQNGAATGTSKSGVPDQAPTGNKKSRRQTGLPDTTVRDHPSSTPSTTGASGQSDTQPSNSTMGTSGSTPGTDNPQPSDNGASTPQSGSPTDQQPNSSSSPIAPNSHLMNKTPGARAMATHTPDPGTCMNPAVQTGQYPSQPVAPNCD